MTKLYLLDTNIASYVIKGSVPAVQRHIERVPMAQLAISAVTEGELLYGVARRPEATRLHAIVNEFLLRVSVQPWDSNVARHYGTVVGDAGRRPAARARAAAARLGRRAGTRHRKPRVGTHRQEARPCLCRRRRPAPRLYAGYLYGGRAPVSREDPGEYRDLPAHLPGA